MKTQTTRTRLGITASTLAIAAACGMALPANAQTLVLPANNSVTTINSALAANYKTVEISNGIDAKVIGSGWNWVLGPNTPGIVLSPSNISTNNPCQNGGLNYAGQGSCLWGGPTIKVDQGGTLELLGTNTYTFAAGTSWYSAQYGFESAIHSDGTIVFEDPGEPSWSPTGTVTFVGTNYLNGNLKLLSGARVASGMSWDLAHTQFGDTTNILLGAGSKFNIYQSSATPLVMGGAISGTGTLTLYNGTLVVNGQNTAANPFTGTMTVKPGQTLVIGDSSHATAIYGDPGHPTGTTLTIAGTTSGAPTLRGYGTIDAVVANNGGVVWPGYNAGTLGNLTVAGYSQDTIGTLKVEVSPTQVAGLHVLGNASLNGTLNVTIDSGAYTTKIYNIVQVDGTMTGSFSSITTSSDVAGAIAAVTKTANGYQVVTEVVQGAAASAPIVVGHLASANRLNNYFLVGSLYDRVAAGPGNATEIGRSKYVWVEAFGRHSGVSRNDVGYHTTAEGFTVGAEYRPAWHNATVGVAASYSMEALKAKGASTADINTWHVAGYGGADVQYMRLDGVLFYNGYTTTTKRDFGTDGIAKSSPGGYAYGGSVQISKSLYRGLITPYLRGVFTRQHLEASVETGATLLDLSYKAINANTFAGDIGFRINPLRSYPDSRNTVLITVALEHDFSALGETVKGTFPVTNGQDWSSYWRGDSENTGLVGIHFTRQVTDRLEISGRVNGRVSIYQTAGEIALNARYRF